MQWKVITLHCRFVFTLHMRGELLPFLKCSLKAIESGPKIIDKGKVNHIYYVMYFVIPVRKFI